MTISAEHMHLQISAVIYINTDTSDLYIIILFKSEMDNSHRKFERQQSNIPNCLFMKAYVYNCDIIKKKYTNFYTYIQMNL